MLDIFQERYWDYYAALGRYRDSPTTAEADRLRLEFDELFGTRTGYAALDDRIDKTAAKKHELLTVLSHPEVPLHNNASELGARVSARRRDVSLTGTDNGSPDEPRLGCRRRCVFVGRAHSDQVDIHRIHNLDP